MQSRLRHFCHIVAACCIGWAAVQPGTTVAQSIPWRADYLLTWGDFQGVPDPSSTFSATTHYDINRQTRWDGKGTITTTVNCAFNKQKSWKRPDRNLTQKLLLHEQLHFYIGEIIARRMRQAFAEYAATHRHDANTSAEMQKIFDRLMDESQKYNDQYDLETDHSKNEQKQEEWRKKIVADMQVLAAYASQ